MPLGGHVRSLSPPFGFGMLDGESSRFFSVIFVTITSSVLWLTVLFVYRLRDNVGESS